MIKGLQITHGKFTNIASFINYANSWTTTLYLTGSRYFGNDSENSDWDFFCYATEPFIQKLIEEGFDELRKDNDLFESNYTGTGMRIFEIQLGDNSIVQIQVYSTEQEVLVKQNAQKFLLCKTNIKSVADKQERKKMWTLVLSMIDTNYGQAASQLKLTV